MSDYTPGTDEVRDAALSYSATASAAEFDRWLNTVKAGAWEAGYRAGNLDGYFETRDEKNPYREAES